MFLWIKINKLTSVIHASVLLLAINFAITMQSSCGSTRWKVSGFTDYFDMSWWNVSSVTGQMQEKLTSICFSQYQKGRSNYIKTKREIKIHVSVHFLTIKITQWACKNFRGYNKNNLFALSISFLVQALYYSSLERIHVEENFQQRENNSARCVAYVISKHNLVWTGCVHFFPLLHANSKPYKIQAALFINIIPLN